MTGLKKNWELSKQERYKLIEPNHPQISIVRQCELLGLNRSSYYYQPAPVNPEDIAFMHLIDEIYTKLPFYGAPRITDQLKRDGYTINHKRVERLMRIMGIQAIYPKGNLSKNSLNHTKYPYLLNGLNINHPNHVWVTDITYIRARNNWFYLTVILDLFSRYILSWKLSRSLQSDFCIASLKAALEIACPEIHNSDQGSQYTAKEYLDILKQHEIRISMDGRGRCFDNIFNERLWRTIKYEEIYLKDYQDFDEAEYSLGQYINLYNNERLHSSIGQKPPAEVYLGKTHKVVKKQSPLIDFEPIKFYEQALNIQTL